MRALSPGTLGCAKLRKYKLFLPRTDGGDNLIITCLYLQVTSKLLFTSHNTIALICFSIQVNDVKCGKRNPIRFSSLKLHSKKVKLVLNKNGFGNWQPCDYCPSYLPSKNVLHTHQLNLHDM